MDGHLLNDAWVHQEWALWISGGGSSHKQPLLAVVTWKRPRGNPEELSQPASEGATSRLATAMLDATPVGPASPHRPHPCRASTCNWAKSVAESVALISSGQRTRRRRSHAGHRRRTSGPVVAGVSLAVGGLRTGLQQSVRAARPKTLALGVLDEGLVAGACASLLSKAVLQPFDTTKTIMQSRGAHESLLHCITDVFGKRGLVGLYRGFWATVAVSVPSSAVYFATYERVKKWVDGRLPPPMRGLTPMVASGVGNVVASVVRCPPEVVKQGYQAGLYPDIITAVRRIAKEEGLTGFYKGYRVQLARDIPYAMIQFTIYESLKRWHASSHEPVSSTSKGEAQQRPQLHDKQRASLDAPQGASLKYGIHVQQGPMALAQAANHPAAWERGGVTDGDLAAASVSTKERRSMSSRERGVESAGSRRTPEAMKNVLTHFWMGAVAGLAASVLTTPIDVVKTRIMTQAGAQGAARLGFRTTVATMWLREGPTAFTRGMLPRVLYKVPGSAVCLVAYEFVRRLLALTHAVSQEVSKPRDKSLLPKETQSA